jgi:hypothetical protein
VVNYGVGSDFQGIQEFTIPDIYANGGMNVTGFRLVNFQSKNVRDFLEDWQEQDKKAWEGQEKDKFPVSKQSSPCIWNDVTAIYSTRLL